MDDSKKMPKSIAIGLAKAQIYARGVDKRGRNTVGRGYDYATSEDVMAESRKALMEGGRLAFSVMGWSFAPRTEEREAKTKENESGKVSVLATAIGRLRIRYRLICLDDGEEYCDETEAPVVPDFGRPDDKAEFGALTEGHAYALRGLLNLPRGVEGAIDMNQCSGEYPAASAAGGAPPTEQPPPEPPQAGPVASGVPPTSADGWTEAARSMSERLIEQAKDRAIPAASTCKAIENASIPLALRRRAFAALLARVIPEQTDLGALCAWLDYFFAEVPKDTPEREQLRPIVQATADRLGWTMARQNEWLAAQDQQAA